MSAQPDYAALLGDALLSQRVKFGQRTLVPRTLGAGGGEK